jgi:hypothetical protein
MVSESGAICGMRIGRGNRCTRRKPAQMTTLYTTNVTEPDRGSNWGRRIQKPATNHLNYGTSLVKLQFMNWKGRGRSINDLS